MLLDKTAKILITVRNITKYSDLGYICNIGDNLTIDIKYLSTYSRNKVRCECYCGFIKIIEYRLYSANILNGGFFSCSKKCSRIKAEKTNLEKYGFESPIQCNEISEKIKNTNIRKYGVNNVFESELIKDKIKKTNLDKYDVESYTQTNEFKIKIKKTNLDKYGVESYTQTDEFKLKTKKTNLDKYGVESYTQTDEFKLKTKKTNLERYGVESYTQTDEFKTKFRETNLEKYGVESYTQTDEFKFRVKETNLDKYGVESYTQTDEFKFRVKETNLKRYGVDHPMKLNYFKKAIEDINVNKYGEKYFFITDEFKNKSKKTSLFKYDVDFYTKSEDSHKNTSIGSNKDYIKYLENGISLFNCSKGHTFEINSDVYSWRSRGKLSLCTVCNPISNSKSIKEIMLFNFISENYKGEIIQSYRDGIEIDIYLPELKIGFEFNGLYWHSSKFKEKNYHLDKANYFKEKGIRVIHIYEDEWLFKEKIVKSQIKNLLKVNSKKIFARKCFVKEIKDSKIVTKFLNENHIQGKVNSTLKLGLYHDDELVSLMTFDRFEGRLKMEEGGWNLNRFCNVINTSVVGSASKLLSYFIKNYDVRRIVSYADKDWSVGKLYETLGFDKLSESAPDYKYIVDNQRVHKSRYKKDNLNLEDKTKTTEKEEMLKRNIFKIYDCGKIKYQMNI